MRGVGSAAASSSEINDFGRRVILPHVVVDFPGSAGGIGWYHRVPMRDGRCHAQQVVNRVQSGDSGGMIVSSPRSALQFYIFCGRNNNNYKDE